MSARYRATKVTVDLEAVRHNVRLLKPGVSELMAVVKADGYGHGATPVALAALEAGATWLGVATVEEGISLREAGIQAPILILSEFPPGSERDALSARLTPSLYSQEGLALLSRVASGTPIPFHLKIDTGMHRIGIAGQDATAFAASAAGQGLVLDALWTHFASSEDDEVTTKQQLAALEAVADQLRAAGNSLRLLHAANTAASIRHPETHLDLVRTGIGIYGIQPFPGVGSGLVPALRWTSAVTFVKRLEAGQRISYGGTYELKSDSWVATVPVGYADGYPRALGSRADVLIRGRRCRVAGNVTMDQLMVDCAEMEPMAGDEVVLLGTQNEQTISAWELAEHAGTIAYEIVVGIGARVPRQHESVGDLDP
jgi:alanine racemase